MSLIRFKLILAVATVFTLTGTGIYGAAVQVKKTKKPFRDYSYYIPDGLKKGQKTRLIIGFPTVAGSNGHVFSLLKPLADEKKWIIVSPNYTPGNPKKKKTYMVVPGKELGPSHKLVEQFRKDFGKPYKLRKKAVTFGFSAGGRDAMGMAMSKPGRYAAAVVFCPGSIDSAWDSLVNYNQFGKKAGKVPVFFACGKNDQPRYSQMKKVVKRYAKKFKHKAKKVKYYPNTGHTIPSAASPDILAFLRNATKKLK